MIDRAAMLCKVSASRLEKRASSGFAEEVSGACTSLLVVGDLTA